MSEALDRKTLIMAGVAAASLLLFLGAMLWSGSASSRLEEIKRAHAEMQTVGGELKALRMLVEKQEARAKASLKGKGLATTVEQVAKHIGISPKLVSQKSAPSPSPLEERVELKFEKLTLNEAANMFYRLEAQPVLLIVRRVSISPSFESPELLMVDMTVSLLKSGEDGK